MTFEITYILPLLIFAAEIILFPGKIKSRLIKAFKITLPFTLIVAIIFLIRYQVLSLGEFKVNYLAGSFYLTQVLMLKVLLKYLLLLIYPVNLSLNHVISGNFETFRVNINSFDWFIHQSILEPQPILALLIVISLTLLVFWCRKKNPLVSFSIAWLFISFLPFFNLIPQATALSERYLYVASFGFILFLCCVLFYLPKKLGFLILILLVISYGTLTYRRNFDWKYASSIWEAMLRAYPKSALANYFVGTIFEERRENDEAIYYYQRSLELNPNMDYAYNSLAYLYFKQGNSALAKNLLLQELKIQNKILDRNQTDVLLNLSESYALLSKIALKEKKFDEAFEYSQKAITVDADNQDAFLAQDLILAEKPEFKKNAALFDPKGWQQFTNKNYAFAYPINWSAEEKEGKIVLHPFKRQYEITIEKIDGFTNSDKDLFLKSQNQSFGTLVKEESAKVPDTEWAYARIWNDHEQPRLEFYISKKGIIFRVIAFPSTFALKEIFDKVIQSIQVF
ncbi:tetratricopeptide repeat protein [Candidatus Daviesbacteria bacterium]|nr:tetratricopeptide repeat protein [Candidatus Daviesbacteria bacterium]